MVRLSQCKNKRTVIDNNILLTRNRVSFASSEFKVNYFIIDNYQKIIKKLIKFEIFEKTF